MRNTLLVALVCFITSCSTDPVALDYGKDGCYFCKMTIVDPKFGAEIVTSKGKVFKFDALECLINHSKQNSRGKGDSYYTIDYLSGEWLIVEDSYYLRTQSIPSPMGQHITSLGSKADADDLQKSNQGIIQTWDELNDNFLIKNIEN